MEKLIFFDLDDCIVESSTPLQRMVNENTPFKNNRLSELEYMKSMSKFSLDYNAKEIDRAMSLGERPKLIGSIKQGSNDIFKTLSKNSELDALEEQKMRLKRWYHDPLQLSKVTFEIIANELEMFKEERDHFLEEDNKKSFADGLIAYQDIFRKENMIPGAKKMLDDTVNSGEYSKVYVLSHHNGGREEIVKNGFIADSFPKVPFLGLRFHLETYEKGIRRPRSSKALYVMEKFNLRDLNNCILVDDSLENLTEWAKYGGISILYRPLSKDEIYFNKMEDSDYDYPRIIKMDKVLLDEALSKIRGRQLKRI